MVLQHIQSKQNKQNVTAEADKNPNSNSNSSAAATASRGRNTSASKAPVRSKDRASNVNIRDVNLDDVKMMEPKWRSKKYDKITMVTNGNDQQDDQCGSGDAWRERKLTLRDFMVSDKPAELNAAQVHKQMGMCTSEYIVVTEQANAAHERAPTAATIMECEEPANEQDEAEKHAAEVLYSEDMEDDFVIINVH